jgi:hypothetical protein
MCSFCAGSYEDPDATSELTPLEQAIADEDFEAVLEALEAAERLRIKRECEKALLTLGIMPRSLVSQRRFV